MRELGLTGLSEDGRFLVAHDPLTEESFHIPADSTLTSLLGTDGTATQPDREAGTGESNMEPTLSPRDIQTRIRRGESPEQVAGDSGMSLEKVRGFAVPVIAEREYMVEQARKTSVRRLQSSGGPGLLLGPLVDESLAAQGVPPDSVPWDSWRREDGRWSVVVSLSSPAEPATFLFDVKGRYILPADDAAHELIGDLAMQESPEMAIADAVREVADEPSGQADAVDATEQGAEPDLVAEIVEEVLPVEVIEEIEIDVTFDLPVPDDYAEVPAPVSSLKEARDRRALEQLALAVEAAEAAPAEASDVEITEQHDLAVPDTARPSKKKHERRRVPSWDEIMFGGRPD